MLVDTPGLFSPNAERSERARVLVHAQTDRAAAGADAVVHVTSEAPGAKREAAELDAFAAGFPDLGHAPTNALIVMTKADRLLAGLGRPARHRGGCAGLGAGGVAQPRLAGDPRGGAARADGAARRGGPRDPRNAGAPATRRTRRSG